MRNATFTVIGNGASFKRIWISQAAKYGFDLDRDLLSLAASQAGILQRSVEVLCGEIRDLHETLFKRSLMCELAACQHSLKDLVAYSFEFPERKTIGGRKLRGRLSDPSKADMALVVSREGNGFVRITLNPPSGVKRRKALTLAGHAHCGRAQLMVRKGRNRFRFRYNSLF